MYVIKITAYEKWKAIYTVRRPTRQEAMKAAYDMAQTEFSCRLPRTFEDFMENASSFWSNYHIEVLAENAELIL